ncbi:unnamed protein product [Paramecium sonneborni]|uniref:Uncharacterized protein n=1 Tax=Paramecium sonneborni TaxID=65129 RepID=A0A8S1R5L6_9CILI|nr:unnamed protein product [Paramecium sonneborni]
MWNTMDFGNKNEKIVSKTFKQFKEGKWIDLKQLLLLGVIIDAKELKFENMKMNKTYVNGQSC